MINRKPLPGQNIEQYDILIRTIEMMGEVLRRVRDQLLGRKTAEAQEQVRQAAARVGVDLDMARLLDGTSLLAMLSAGGTADPTRCILFGELLFMEGLRLHADGDDASALDCFAKSRLLLESAVAYGIALGMRFPEIEARIAEVESQVAGS